MKKIIAAVVAVITGLFVATNYPGGVTPTSTRVDLVDGAVTFTAETSGDDRLLVAVVLHDHPDCSLASATYDGTALTLIGRGALGTETVDIAALLAPSTGSNDAAVSMSEGVEGEVLYIRLENVSQDALPGKPYIAVGNSDFSIDAVEGDAVLCILLSRPSSTSTSIGGSFTRLQDPDIGGTDTRIQVYLAEDGMSGAAEVTTGAADTIALLIGLDNV